MEHFSASPFAAGDAAAALAPPQSEGKAFAKNRLCPTFSGAFFCGIENDEWVMVRALVSPESTVIEYGARYGTTSCVLAEATQNSGRLVSVEPDRRAHPSLLRNRAQHNCSFHAVLGSVADSPLQITPGPPRNGYGLTSHRAASPAALRDRTHALQVPNVELRAVEDAIGARFDTALIDCEGCIESVNGTGLLSQVDLLLMEEDKIDYGPWREELARLGFERIWCAHDTYDHRLEWSRTLIHTAWARGGRRHGGKPARRLPTCSEYKARHGLSDALLKCCSGA